FQEARDRSEFFLLHTNEVDPIEKHILAEEYNLPKLKPKRTDGRHPFASPSKFSNVVLIVEGKKLHVQKEFLAVYSPVFARMFFGESSEKGKEEVE
ncbi:hypothetical protein PMAYCL1PPCAC_25999, partial [Pristionchus mayeri]